VREGPVHHHHLRALLAQVLGGEPRQLAGAEHEHAPTTDRPEHLLGERRGGVAPRHAGPADGRLGPDPLRHLEDAAERAVQLAPADPRLDRARVRLLHLAQDLRLAQHRRLEARGDPQHVAERVVPVQLEELDPGAAGPLRERLPQRDGGCGGAVARRVDLDAETGREKDELVHAAERGIAPDHVRHLLGPDGEALAIGDGRTLLIEAHGDEHVCAPFPECAEWSSLLSNRRAC